MEPAKIKYMERAKADSVSAIILREVVENDLPVFFEHQHDHDAATMAGFPARDRAAFMAHWLKILQDPTVVARIIVADNAIVGNVVSFVQDGEREVGYWIGRQFWGNGIATAALHLFLTEVERRPVGAYVVKQNIGSLRVLQKCGFSIVAEDNEAFMLERRADVLKERS